MGLRSSETGRDFVFRVRVEYLSVRSRAFGQETFICLFVGEKCIEASIPNRRSTTMLMDFTAPTTRMGSSANRVRISVKSWVDSSNVKGDYCARSYTHDESDCESRGTFRFPFHQCEHKGGPESIADPYFVAAQKLEHYFSPPFQCYQKPMREKIEAGLKRVGGAPVTNMHYDVPRRLENGCSVLGVATKLKKKMQACLLIAQNFESLESPIGKLQNIENKKLIGTCGNGCALRCPAKGVAGHDMTEEYLIPEVCIGDRERHHVKKAGKKIQEGKRKKEHWLMAKAPDAGYKVNHPKKTGEDVNKEKRCSFKTNEKDGDENHSNGKIQEDTSSSEHCWSSWEEGFWSVDGQSSRQGKGYPPPISILRKCSHLEDPNEMPKVCWRAVKRDGKFVLQEEQARPREIFRAIREKGRLRLQLLQPDEVYV
eukprot:c26360_g1_i1 orf=300-1577(+)